MSELEPRRSRRTRSIGELVDAALPPAQGSVDEEILPLTCYATLGLLNTTEEFTAGEVQARAHRYVRFFYWTPALTHIRRELRRLRDLGYVVASEDRQGRLRSVVRYRSTEAGERKLRQWAESGPFEPAVMKNPVLLRLWLGRRAGDKERVLGFLEAHIARIETDRRDLDELIRDSEEYKDWVVDTTDLDESARAEAVGRSEWLMAVMLYVRRAQAHDLESSAGLLRELREINLR